MEARREERRSPRRGWERWVWLVLALVFLVWLAPTLFVALYDPAVPSEPPGIDPVLSRRQPEFFLFAPGYIQTWAVETESESESEGTVRTREHYMVQRGLLDRAAGTFHLIVGCELDHAEDLVGAVLLVASYDDGDWLSDAEWTRVAEAEVEQLGGGQTRYVARADVPATSTAFRVREIRTGATARDFSKSVPRAPSALGRLHDRIAWWPIFRWVPDLR